ncbi:carboxymuconolactone decarboxylase family protein [Mesorhizobium sp. M1A.F.Ca.ET.072.01.1.1]|uniref:carboxymuconolactone decarboxylase family protein n=1 Tax=Mesorhizobium sp. M1A.F.Ca.ET.072.01.1.1 TaxID=2496753 RepID=UPI000FD58444|nr:carboxymuconolactone decarboxylase family protein [Mesorhizobium sp. M1A.F.Ca.ET.072.01.1.1]RUW54423.1 carboxymuconolactone decarboxylase family protein [Mesorhizobium sp. M1A.F.Ca.ET.072.01.1.1]TIV04818.1 MAG: carboxymuconolactone decarboxylase family protein [Mesorhizobium sp.]
MNFSPEPQSRCPPLADEDWPAEIADMKAGFAGALNVYRTMARHPALLKAWAPLRQHIVKDSSLGDVRSELVILRSAYRMGSDYEWVHHVSRARALGIADARIQGMRNSPDGEDGLFASAVDALFDSGCLPPEIESAVAEALGQQAVFDLIATVGFYSILGYVLKTYETPVDRDVAVEFQKRPL